MRFVYGRQDWATRERGQENVYLLTNGLGGFSSASMINSNTRNDQALLMASLRAPNLRYNMVNRLEERLETADAAAMERMAACAAAPEGDRNPRSVCLSSQEFTDAARNENGYLYLNSFVYEDYPEWTFQAGGVEVVKRVALAQGKNLAVVQYRVDNRTDAEVRLTVTPHMQFVPKGQALKGTPVFAIRRCGGKGAAGRAAEEKNASEAEKRVSSAECGRGYAEADEIYEITANGLHLYLRTNGQTEMVTPRFCDGAYYAYDACDGRDSVGRTCVLCEITKTVPAHESTVLEILFNTEEDFPETAGQVFDELTEYRESLRGDAAMVSDAARQLAAGANQFISERESTGGQTILAGYPFFEDWGRDTMIALEGCCMSTGQYDTAKSILRTFAAYCRKGLMPNLFPEGGVEPRYNTADAALLFINSVFAYVTRTCDMDFVREMWPVMAQIIEAYRDGTDYGIRMDEDGLIQAGQEYDQVTWMDVRIGDHLPTPRHGKPVEINAYWYNALKVMEKLGSGPYFGETEILEDDTATAGAAKAGMPGRSGLSGGKNVAREAGIPEGSGLSGGKNVAGETEMPGKNGSSGEYDVAAAAGWPPASQPAAFGRCCGFLAELTKESFLNKFWMEDKGWLKDVLSGTKADEQFRCNQIWAVSMPFSMLDRQQERRIVDAVYEKLYTPYGLRTLAMDDPEFHGTYGGELRARDLAYHQGTVWVFPLGAYYLAYLRSRDHAPEAVQTVRRQLSVLESAMREGCIGQLPEIYDGGRPAFSRGCFAQAWSVGEILRVYEVVERGEFS